MPPMQRVPNAEFPPALKKRLEALWGSPPNLYRALGNHAPLAAAWTEFARAIRFESRTPRMLRELIILRGAQLMRSEYEWAQHLKMARKAGVREAQIAALAGWRDSSEFDAREQAALELAEAVTRGEVGDAVYAAVSKHFDHATYVELAMVAAFYAMVARMLDAMRIQLEPDARDYAPRLPKPA
jgi:alkylhydroperoxidase family enzyme